jgi:hypothetical protein
MTNWRPEGWENPYSREYLKELYGDRPYQLEDYEAKIFEAGVNAMLEALRKQGSDSTERGFRRTKGVIVFIPDDKEKER